MFHTEHCYGVLMTITNSSKKGLNGKARCRRDQSEAVTVIVLPLGSSKRSFVRMS